MGTTSESSAISRLAFISNAHTRLRRMLWPIVQTSIGAGLAWYIAHSALGHAQPFFAPIAAAVSLSASNVLRGQRALQLIGGVTLGIVIGIGAQALIGVSAVALGVAVLIALSAALVLGQGFIAHGLMFFNQTAASAILVIALHRGASGPERLLDALIGGGVAIVISVLLFPADPLSVTRDAERALFATLAGALHRIELLCSDRELLDSGCARAAARAINGALTGLDQSRATARTTVRVAPRRWKLREAVAQADSRAGQLELLASVVLGLVRLSAQAREHSDTLPGYPEDAIRALASVLAMLAEQGLTDESRAAAKAQLAYVHSGEFLSQTLAHGSLITSIARVATVDLRRVLEDPA